MNSKSGPGDAGPSAENGSEPPNEHYRISLIYGSHREVSGVHPGAAALLKSITGVDAVALLLLLHVWLIAVLPTYYQDGPFVLGIDWADRQIDLSWRSLAVLWLVATVVA